MSENRRGAESSKIEGRIGEFREGVTDADATGMVADEASIAQAEVLAPLLRDPPLPPSRAMHAALEREHAAHATIDRLHAAVEAASPSRPAIEEHVGHLRAVAELEAIVATWWESPATQRFVWSLSQIGL